MANSYAAHWILVALLFWGLVVNAKHPLTYLPRASEDIETTYHFPGHDDHKFPVGEPLTVLCHVQNNGLSAVNITAIMGSLNVAFQFHQYVQNYSYKSFGAMLKPDEELTLQYEFEINKELDTQQEYALAHTVFYQLEKPSKLRHSTTFFNQTVEIYNAAGDFETESVLELIMVLFSTVLVALMVFAACFPDHPYVNSLTLAVHGSGLASSFMNAASPSKSPTRGDKKQD